jgi:hypothetical protein
MQPLRLEPAGKLPTIPRNDGADDVIDAQADENAVVAGPSANLPNCSEPLALRERTQSNRGQWMRSLWTNTGGRFFRATEKEMHQ